MASTGGASLPMFRSHAPRLYKQFFTCHQCLRRQDRATALSIRRFAASAFSQNTARGVNSPILNTTSKQFKPLLRSRASLSTTANAAQNASAATKSRFPDVSSKAVAYWLLGSAASVFGIVVFGGLTRLTESGCAGVPLTGDCQTLVLTGFVGVD